MLLYSSYHQYINSKIEYLQMEANDRVKDLQEKNSQLNRSLRRLFYFSLGSISTLLCGLIYSNYQTFRKQRQIDDKNNLIERQKQQMKLLNSRADILSQQLAEQIKSIVKNLKNSVLDYSSKNLQENSLKTEINDAFHNINTALNSKIQAVKNYGYKENLQRWYLANMVSTNVGVNYDRLKKIELLQTKWLINDHKDKEKGFIWRRNGENQIKGLQVDEQNQQFSTKLREYFGRKTEIEGKGVSINLPNYITNYIDQKKRILIKYKCWGFDIKTGLFTVPLKHKGERNILQQQITKMIKEGQENYLQCNDKQWIRSQ